MIIVQTALCTHVEKKTINEALSFYYNLHSIIERKKKAEWTLGHFRVGLANNEHGLLLTASQLVHGFKPPSNHPLKQKCSLWPSNPRCQRWYRWKVCFLTQKGSLGGGRGMIGPCSLKAAPSTVFGYDCIKHIRRRFKLLFLLSNIKHHSIVLKNPPRGQSTLFEEHQNFLNILR